MKIMNFSSDGIEEYSSLVAELERNKYRSIKKKLELDIKYPESPPARPSIEEAPKLELKVVPPHMRYLFVGRDDNLLVIIASDLNAQLVECLVGFLKRFKRAIGWTIVDIIGIPNSICSQKILLMPNHKLCIEHQRLYNQPMNEVVKKEIIK